jgi:hypothetical protein
LLALYVLVNLSAMFFFTVEIVLGIHGRVLGFPVPIKGLLLAVAALMAWLRWCELRAAVRLWLDGRLLAAVRRREWAGPTAYLLVEVVAVVSVMVQGR